MNFFPATVQGDHLSGKYFDLSLNEEEQALLSKLMVRIAERAEDYVKGGDCACEPSENT